MIQKKLCLGRPSNQKSVLGKEVSVLRSNKEANGNSERVGVIYTSDGRSCAQLNHNTATRLFVMGEQ